VSDLGKRLMGKLWGGSELSPLSLACKYEHRQDLAKPVAMVLSDAVNTRSQMCRYCLDQPLYDSSTTI